MTKPLAVVPANDTVKALLVLADVIEKAAKSAAK